MKNKNKFLVAVIFIYTILLLCGCESALPALSAGIIEETFAAAQELNANSDLGMEYLGKFDLPEVFLENRSNHDPYILYPNPDVIGTYYPFPYGEEYTIENIYITKITIRGSSHHLFGITVGDSLEQASGILFDRGYKMTGTEEINSTNCVTFKKACIAVRLDLEEDNSTIQLINILTY